MLFHHCSLPCLGSLQVYLQSIHDDLMLVSADPGCTAGVGEAIMGRNCHKFCEYLSCSINASRRRSTTNSNNLQARCSTKLKPHSLLASWWMTQDMSFISKCITPRLGPNSKPRARLRLWACRREGSSRCICTSSRNFSASS